MLTGDIITLKYKDQIMAIHIHLHSSQTKVRDRKVKDIIKPYVSTILPGGGSKGYYEVLNSKGQTVKTFPYTPAGREEARRFVQSHYNELTKDADPISMSKSKVLEKCKSGEWEAMQDIVANRTLQFRKNGKTFFVKVTDNKVKDIVASSKVKAHPNYTKNDFDYLTAKGWTEAEILKRWDEERRQGSRPVTWASSNPIENRQLQNKLKSTINANKGF